MWTRSLSIRAALIAAGGSALALFVAGVVFVVQFSNTVEQNFDLRLETLLVALAAATDANGNVNDAIVEGRSGNSFSRALSGWYWMIRDAETGATLHTSQSLIYDVLAVPGVVSQVLPTRLLTIEASAGRRLRVLEQLVTLAPGQTYALLVAGDTVEMREDIASFRRAVAWWLGGLALLLSVGIALLMRWGLRPLRYVRDDLRRVREGEVTHLQGRYPVELEPLVEDLNALIDSNREIVERARTHVGNLAHALKTPLAVLQNEAARGEGPLAAKTAEQTGIMRDQVEHHLKRARIAAQANVLGAVTQVEPVLAALARVMGKVHRDRALDIDVDVEPADVRFRGEKQDLEEMVGNLLDNACKWAAARVRVTVRREREERRVMLVIAIDDDGPGLKESDREAALARGARLDETKPGSGLGLSIVAELARIYGGSFGLDHSSLGGLGARLRLPAAGS